MSPPGHPVATAAPLLLAIAALLAIGDLEAKPGATITVLAAAVGAFAYAAVRLRAVAVEPRVLLLVALALRLCALPLAPTLSDDVYRYLWDGRVANAGRNPYFHSPDDPELVSLRDRLWERVAHREVETVYPPLAIAAFSIAARSHRPLLAWKSILVAVDLASCLLLLRLARARAVPTGRAIAYAWNPLVVVEVAGMGHVDALGVAPLLAGALLLRPPSTRRRSAAAGALAGLGVLAKLVPALLVPAWTRASPKRVLFAAALAVVVTIAALPFAVGVAGPPPGLVTYAVSWEFNGPLFEPLWRGLNAVEAAPWVKARLDQIKHATGDERWNRVYPYVYPQLLAKVVLGIALTGVVAASLRRRDPVGAALFVFGGALILSATVYPWYAVWVLPWAALEWGVPWLVLSASLFAAYLPRLLDVPLLPWPFLLVWGPFLLGLMWTRVRPTG